MLRELQYTFKWKFLENDFIDLSRVQLVRDRRYVWRAKSQKFLQWANFGGKCSSRFIDYQNIFFFKKSWSKIFYSVFCSKWKIDFFNSFKKYLNFHNSYKVNKIMYSLVFCGRWLRIWCYFFNFQNGGLNIHSREKIH